MKQAKYFWFAMAVFCLFGAFGNIGHIFTCLISLAMAYASHIQEKEDEELNKK